MKKAARRRIAEEAARFMVDGVESEYLNAKERAMMMLGLSDQSRMPSNRQIKECIQSLTKEELGEDEVKRRLRQMREIAAALMATIEDFDPHLIGSTLTGEIRATSDIDLHAYCDDLEVLLNRLSDCGYEDIEVEQIENRKGNFVHFRWAEEGYPVEITIYPWSWRELVMYSSVTGKPMKRANLKMVNGLLKQAPGSSK